ncbi:Hpt domain-containing protein [Ferrovibrio sp.]|uniref:Hpt domain-containing protein n=1 Tax=Ferrovibrio sp. TaxID=1917215 RepID=UPI0025C3A13E|nr:Hpt domain-containing protein [Ferrovibrio sp.]MBX3455391.1 Hpt domain-containing protein [Ferrovibrio sp.]
MSSDIRSPKPKFIPNRGDLKRKAVNFKKGLELKLDDGLRDKLNNLVQESAAAFLDESAARIKALREQVSHMPADPAARKNLVEEIREEAFQIKGMGGLFGFPLLTEFAKSLHDFLKETDDDLDELQQEIVSIHVDTMYVVIAHKIAGSGGALEAQLRASLKAAVDKAKHKATQA